MQWDALDIPDPETPIGARGIGEPPVGAGCMAVLNALWDALDGASEKLNHPIERKYSAKAYVYDPIPKRDSRFIDPFNRGVNPIQPPPVMKPPFGS